jgi:hypothetical protein
MVRLTRGIYRFLRSMTRLDSKSFNERNDQAQNRPGSIGMHSYTVRMAAVVLLHGTCVHPSTECESTLTFSQALICLHDTFSWASAKSTPPYFASLVRQTTHF